jgi:DnaJ-class molecular chaperone
MKNPYEVPPADRGQPERRNCDKCGGTGKVKDKKCDRCNGSGKVR